MRSTEEGERGKMIQAIITYAPLFVAPFVLFLFSLISAFVLRFRLPRGGLGFDYVIFSLIVILGLKLGGAI